MLLESARWRLATAWFSGAAIFILVLVGQSMGGQFGTTVNDAWAWALPNIIPTLGLMISIFAAYATLSTAEADTLTVRKPFYRLTLALSIFYILNLILVVVGAPFAVGWNGDGGGKQPIDVLHTSNFWLGPMQGLAAAALGALFFSKADAQTPDV
jgi:hypothetical protein